MSDILILDTKTEQKESDITAGFSIESINKWLISKQGIKTEQKVIFFRLLATMVMPVFLL